MVGSFIDFNAIKRANVFVVVVVFRVSISENDFLFSLFLVCLFFFLQCPVLFHGYSPCIHSSMVVMIGFSFNRCYLPESPGFPLRAFIFTIWLFSSVICSYHRPLFVLSALYALLHLILKTALGDKHHLGDSVPVRDSRATVAGIASWLCCLLTVVSNDC